MTDFRQLTVDSLHSLILAHPQVADVMDEIDELVRRAQPVSPAADDWRRMASNASARGRALSQDEIQEGYNLMVAQLVPPAPDVAALQAELAEARRVLKVNREQIETLQKLIREDVTPAGIEVARFRESVAAAEKRADTLAADLAALHRYIESKHNGYDEASRRAMGMQKPATHLDALKALVTEEESLLSLELRDLRREFAEDREENTKLRADLAAAVARVEKAERSHDMTWNAWTRELGEAMGGMFPKTHPIDSAVLTTRKLGEELKAARAELRQLREAPVPDEILRWKQDRLDTTHCAKGCKTWDQVDAEAVALMTRAAAPPQPVPVATDAEVEAAIATLREMPIAGVVENGQRTTWEAFVAKVEAMLRQRTAPPPPSSGNQRALDELRRIKANVTHTHAMLMRGRGEVGENLMTDIQAIDVRIAALQAEQPTAPVPHPQKPEATRADPLELCFREVTTWPELVKAMKDCAATLPVGAAQVTWRQAAGLVERMHAELVAKPAPLQADAAGTAVLRDCLHALESQNGRTDMVAIAALRLAGIELLRTELARRQAIDSLDDRVRRLEAGR